MISSRRSVAVVSVSPRVASGGVGFVSNPTVVAVYEHECLSDNLKEASALSTAQIESFQAMPTGKHWNANSVLPKWPDMTDGMSSRVIHIWLRVNDRFEMFEQCNFMGIFNIE